MMRSVAVLRGWIMVFWLSDMVPLIMMITGWLRTGENKVLCNLYVNHCFVTAGVKVGVWKATS